MDILQDIDLELLPSKTYRLVGNRILGTVDGPEAIKQAVDKILRTERYVYLIYNGDYGVELERFIGENFDFIKADLERTIEDALTADDRISGISDFEMEQTATNALGCKFTVNTIEGSYNQQQEVGIR